jgi:hypothetical protein
MAHLTKDVQSVVKFVGDCYSQIASLQDSNLTSIQREQASARIHQSLQDEGIQSNLPSYGSTEKVTSGLSLYVRDSGVITDVSPIGAYPIKLLVGKTALVAFEPRDISRVSTWEYTEIDNTRFSSLSKGDSYSFSGRLLFCNYYPGTSGCSFELRVDSEFRLPTSVVFADWLRKQLWGGRSSGVDFIRKKY